MAKKPAMSGGLPQGKVNNVKGKPDPGTKSTQGGHKKGGGKGY